MSTKFNIADFHAAQFEAARNPIQWWSQAGVLIQSADILYRKWEEFFHSLLAMDSGAGVLPRDKFAEAQQGSQMHHVYLMLAGMAIECLIKGIKIGRDPNIISQVTKVGKTLGGHDIVRQYANLNLQTTPETEALLRTLTEYIKWLARYPVPNAFHDLKKKEAVATPASTYFSETKQEIDKLYDFLAEILKTEDRQRKAVKPREKKV